MLCPLHRNGGSNRSRAQQKINNRKAWNDGGYKHLTWVSKIPNYFYLQLKFERKT